jgi:hypothetical protein
VSLTGGTPSEADSEADAAQQRGEVAGHGGQARFCDAASKVGSSDLGEPTTSDLGIDRRDIHEARQLRDAEQAATGTVESAVNAMLEAGEAPTAAAVDYWRVIRAGSHWMIRQ